MLEVLKFIFSEWYIFFGTLLLIGAVGGVIGEIILDIVYLFKK